MGGACRDERRVQGFGGKTWEKENTSENQARWKDNIKMILYEVGCVGMDWIDLSQNGQVAGTFECGNKLSGSIKCGEFLDLLKNS